MSTPADFYGPFNGQDAYEGDWRDIFGSWLADGVLSGLDDELLVYGDASGRNVKVGAGRVRMIGSYARWDAESTVAVDPNTSGNPRIDRLVARATLDAGALSSIDLDVLYGTPATSPSPPDLTHDASTWEVSLAQIACANGFTTLAADKVTPERGLLSAYAMPTFDTITARGLWVPDPSAGFECFVVETGGRYVYAEAAWRQQRRAQFHAAYTPSGTEDTGSNATWPVGLTTSVAVPAWATGCYMRAKIGQTKAVSGTAANVGVTLFLGALAADAVRVRWTTSGDIEKDLILEGDLDVTSIAGTTVTARTLGNIVSGATALRVDDESSCFLRGEFR